MAEIDYKKKYEEALSRAREVKQHYNKPEYSDVVTYFNEDIPFIFPELKSEENEEIRKTLIEFFSRKIDDSFLGISNERIVSLLENDTRVKLDDDIRDEFKEKLAAYVDDVKRGLDTEESLDFWADVLLNIVLEYIKN